VKKLHIIFITIFSLLIALQTFFWLFANSAEPIILGMPFSMFFVVLLIVIQFVALLILYYFDQIKPNQKEKK